MSKKWNFVMLIAVIVLSAFVGSMITYLYLDRVYYLEAHKFNESSVNAERVNLTFDSNTDGLTYTVKGNYPKLTSNEGLKVKRKAKSQFFIERNLNADCPQMLYITINHKKEVIGKFNIKLFFPKDDNLYPSEIRIHVSIQFDSASNKGKCLLICSRHKDLFKIDKQEEEIRLSSEACQEVYFGM